MTRIANRDGLGEILGLGAERAAARIGTEAVSQIRHSDPYDPRLYLSTALLWATEPREPIQQLHEVGFILGKWVTWTKDPQQSYLNSDVLKAIARTFWGSEIAGDFTTCEGKALAAKMIQERQYIKECLLLCDFLYPILDIPTTEDHVGATDLEARYLSAVTGRDVTEESLRRIGERVFNLQRAVLTRDGRKGREYDTLPEQWHTTPLAGGIVDFEALVPDKDGNVISRVGAVVDKQEFEQMKTEYYQLREWDKTNGLQKRDTLENLGLKDVADDLDKRGLLAPQG